MSLTKKLASLVAVSVVTGLVASGVFIPVTGASVAVAGAGLDLFDSLPKELESPRV